MCLRTNFWENQEIEREVGVGVAKTRFPNDERISYE